MVLNFLVYGGLQFYLIIEKEKISFGGMEKWNALRRNNNLGPLIPQTPKRQTSKPKALEKKEPNQKSKPPDFPQGGNGPVSTCIEGLTDIYTL